MNLKFLVCTLPILVTGLVAGCTSDPYAPINRSTPIRQMDNAFDPSGSRYYDQRTAPPPAAYPRGGYEYRLVTVLPLLISADLNPTGKKENALFRSRIFRIAAMLTVALSMAACGRTTGTRAVTGGLLGAGGGALVGGATGLGAGTGALIGGAGGAGAGALTAHH